MDAIWILAAIFAAACQTARSAFQKNMIPRLGDYGAAYIRFCYALPFTSLIWLVWIYYSGHPIPDLTTYTIILCCLGSIFQILFTYVLMQVFSHKSFAAGIGFSKTEVILIAFLEVIILNVVFSLPLILGILLGVISVLFLSFAKKAETVLGTFKYLFNSMMSMGTLIGLLSGLLLAASVVTFRMAIISVDAPLLDKSLYISFIAIVFQTILVGLYLFFFKKEQFFAVFKYWKPSLPAGICGTGATFGWFVAFGLATAAEVRAVGQIELIFSIFVSLLVFKEKIKRTELIGILLLGVSILIIINNKF
jgi:drug/metabolite transporter (DMT)-like permease